MFQYSYEVNCAIVNAGYITVNESTHAKNGRLLLTLACRELVWQ